MNAGEMFETKAEEPVTLNEIDTTIDEAWHYYHKLQSGMVYMLIMKALRMLVSIGREQGGTISYLLRQVKPLQSDRIADLEKSAKEYHDIAMKDSANLALRVQNLEAELKRQTGYISELHEITTELESMIEEQRKVTA